METKHKAAQHPSGTCSLCECHWEKLHWCVLWLLGEKNCGGIDAFVTSVGQEKPSECPAASAAILCLIFALGGTKQRA